MEVQQILSMKGGDGDSSYATNSLLQTNAILKAKSIVQESIREVYNRHFSECIKIADMGCSSGPTAFIPIFEMIESINTSCGQLNRMPPVLQVFLNDLHINDFNAVFKSLPSFYDQLEKSCYYKDNTDNTTSSNIIPCFVAGVPGSFHGRLFPDRSLHFVHSSFSLHWLSQVPKELVSESRVALNKGNIYIAETSPPGVHKAYLDQFQTDFTAFLRSRSKETISGGRMVLTFLGNNNEWDPACNNYCPNIWEVFSVILNDMVTEGLIEESILDSFNIPLYMPSAEEAQCVIDKEGSFKIHMLETYRMKWDGDLDNTDKKDLAEIDLQKRAKRVSRGMKAVAESILASHFGEALTDNLFNRFTHRVFDNIKKGKDVYTNLIISLEKF